MAGWLLGIAILIFLLSSTYYLPGYLVDKLERQYTPFNLQNNKIDTGRVLIIVLGSGYTLDKRLPANAQIGLCALGRLAEAIRIHRSINNSLLVCCGYSSMGLETQAQVTKRAAIVLGVEASKIETLNKPRTTQEEAKEFARQYLQTSNIILVTDAIHMPRAMKLFQLKGLDPMAAPTNYKINEGPAQESMKWWPSLGNIGLMNYFIHEYLGKLKASIAD
ncbi:MAG: ElyC/SanA/YdcF family protein [Ferruginibacter sp.]